MGQGKPGDKSVSREQVQEQLAQAAQSAERAVEDRRLPGRYDSLIRKYFRRLPETVPQASEPAVMPAPDAK
jgi:hypothetical protein